MDVFRKRTDCMICSLVPSHLIHSVEWASNRCIDEMLSWLSDASVTTQLNFKWEHVPAFKPKGCFQELCKRPPHKTHRRIPHVSWPQKDPLHLPPGKGTLMVRMEACKILRHHLMTQQYERTLCMHQGSIENLSIAYQKALRVRTEVGDSHCNIDVFTAWRNLILSFA